MPRRTEDRQVQVAVPVRDRAAEFGINLNTILTGLILGVMLWVGTTLNEIRKDLSSMSTLIEVIKTDQSNLRREFDEHRHNARIHRP